MLYALLAIAVLVLLVTRLKFNPFIALLISSLALGAAVVAVGSGAQGLGMATVLKAFQDGFGATLGSTGSIIVLGVVFGKLLAESGGAGVLARTFIRVLGPSRIGLCIILLALCVGMTTWFAVGLLLILPIVITLAKETGQPFLRLVLPLLSFLSVMHGLMPPHPGPVVAIEALKADMGLVILWALVLGIPVAAVAGPIFARAAVRYVHVPTPEYSPSVGVGQKLPGFGLTLFTVLLPVILLLGGTVVEVLVKNAFVPDAATTAWGRTLLFLGHPLMALLRDVGLRLALRTFRRGAAQVLRVERRGHRHDPRARRRGRGLRPRHARGRHRPRTGRPGLRSRTASARVRLARLGLHPGRHRLGHRGHHRRLRVPGSGLVRDARSQP
jgi:GntP family gluconate:H+ symporter